jgi:hypothetical protein
LKPDPQHGFASMPGEQGEPGATQVGFGAGAHDPSVQMSEREQQDMDESQAVEVNAQVGPALNSAADVSERRAARARIGIALVGDMMARGGG